MHSGRQLVEPTPVAQKSVAAKLDKSLLRVPVEPFRLGPGDVIVRVDGRALIDERTRESLFFEARVGLTVRLTVWRDGDTFDVDITLEEA